MVTAVKSKESLHHSGDDPKKTQVFYESLPEPILEIKFDCLIIKNEKRGSA